MQEVLDFTEVRGSLPVNMYASRGKLTVVAPMPGLEPENIVITVGGETLAIHGNMRGELQDGKDYLIHEWQVGPYIRAVRLPFPVDGSKANVTFNNGILAISLPEARETKAQRIYLDRISAISGERVGWSGFTAQPSQSDFVSENTSTSPNTEGSDNPDGTGQVRRFNGAPKSE
ncbi:MAG TPA: Hsp20/alpha crystallin family protein [Chloroflexota bacterium]|nr:Hsp20/alpha crystallin family protein [Chloroflexota bacterium]